jgi:hypothetical protein
VPVLAPGVEPPEPDADGRQHYLYRVAVPTTGETYVGGHSSKRWQTDRYMGSGSWIENVLIPSDLEFTFTVLAFYPTRRALFAAEALLITAELAENPLCRNVHPGGQWAPDDFSVRWSEVGRRANAAMTAGQRSERSRRINANLTPAQKAKLSKFRSLSASAYRATLPPEERVAAARRANAGMTSEQRAAMNRERLAAMPRDDLLAHMHKMQASITPEVRQRGHQRRNATVRAAAEVRTAKILALDDAGYVRREIAALMDLCYPHVCHVLSRAGRKPNGTALRRTLAERTYEQQLEVYRKQQATRRANAALKPLDPRVVIAATLQADGASLSEIDEAIGLTAGAVFQLLAQARHRAVRSAKISRKQRAHQASLPQSERGRGAGEYFANETADQRAARIASQRAAWNQKTPEERSELARRRDAKMTPAARSARSRKGATTKTPEARRRRQRNGRDPARAHGPDHRARRNAARGRGHGGGDRRGHRRRPLADIAFAAPGARERPTLFHRRGCEKVAPAGQFEAGGRVPVTCLP